MCEDGGAERSRTWPGRLGQMHGHLYAGAGRGGGGGGYACPGLILHRQGAPSLPRDQGLLASSVPHPGSHLGPGPG